MFNKLPVRLVLGFTALSLGLILAFVFLSAKPSLVTANTVSVQSDIPLPTLAPVLNQDVTPGYIALTAGTTYSPIIAATPEPEATAPTPLKVVGGKANTNSDPTFSPLHLRLAGLPAAVYIPQNLQPNQSVQLLVALHGMYGNGGAFCLSLVNFAEQHHLILLAPTFNYNADYKNPKVIIGEDVKLTAQLNQIVNELSATTHISIKERLLLYGFSRGAQLAHHYAEFYPKQTLAVTVFSGGAYTLPFTSLEGKNNQVLAFPYGIGDLSEYDGGKTFDRADFIKIPFNVEVGAKDTDPSGVSRAWDQYLGTTRLERNQYFYQALKQLGMVAQFTIFPNTAHDVSPAMNATSLKFMEAILTS